MQAGERIFEVRECCCYQVPCFSMSTARSFLDVPFGDGDVVESVLSLKRQSMRMSSI